MGRIMGGGSFAQASARKGLFPGGRQGYVGIPPCMGCYSEEQREGKGTGGAGRWSTIFRP